MIKIYRREDVGSFVGISGKGFWAIHNQNRWKYGEKLNQVNHVEEFETLPEVGKWFKEMGCNPFGETKNNDRR